MVTLNSVMKKLKAIYESLSVNARDIFSTLFWITGVLLITQIIAIVGDSLGVDLHDIKDFVFAIGKFAAVALCGVGYLVHVTFRQSLGQFDINKFMETWNTKFTDKEKLEWFFKISIAGLIAAALVFSIGV